MKRILALIFLLPSLAVADTNITVPRNAIAIIQFELRDAEGATPGLDLEASAACASGDVTVLEDQAASATSTNCFVDEGNGEYSLTLAAAEVDGKVTTVKIVDQTGTKVWVDKVINVYTYGDSAAFHAVPNVNVSTITDGAITSADFASGAITADAIATNAIGDNELNITGSEFSAIPWNASWDAEVQSEVVDAINVDTYTELTSCPAATASFKTMLQYLYMLGRNKFTQTATTGTLLRDDGSTGLCTFTDSDAAGTFTRGEGS